MAIAAARSAAALSSHGEARELYATALRTAPGDISAADRADLLRAFADQAAATDDNGAAAEAYEAARSAYHEAGDSAAAAALAGPLSAVRHLLGDGLDRRAALLGAALVEVDEAFGEGRLDAVAADRTRASLRAELAAAYMLDRRLDEAMVHAAEAGRLANAAGLDAVDRHAATTLGACEVFGGHMADGWARLETAIERSRTEELETEAARAYRMLGSCASVLVEYDRAEHWLREGVAYAERVELWNHRHYMAAHLAHVLWATGRWAEAGSVAGHALADGRGGITTRITALHVLGYLALGRGDGAAALDRLVEARELGERMHELQRLSPAVWGLAELALLEGDAPRAVALTDDGAVASEAVADAAYLFPFAVTGTRARLAVADPEGARTWVERVTAGLERRAIPGTLAAIPHARGLLALADGRTAQARTDLHAAADAWRARGRSWEAMWADVDLARAYRRAHRPADAARHLASARTTATATGATAVLDAVDTLTREAVRRGHDGGAAGSSDPWWPLTAREWEVARLVADGHTNGEVADRLGVSPRTVSAHVEHILARLGVARRAEIAAWAARRPVLHSRPHGEDREE
jgi:DNA-binding CsgD family transcriptional regulator